MYKLLLCWRYLRTRWIALASIVSVTLGVATLVVVNSVMDGFTSQMQERMHGILSDLVVETRSTAGLSQPDWYVKRIHERLGDKLSGVTTVVTLPAMMTFTVNGQSHTQQINLIGIDESTYADVSDFSKYLLHPTNQKQLNFQLQENGYDPAREALQPAGWEHRRYAEALKKENAKQQRLFREEMERYQQLQKEIRERQLAKETPPISAEPSSEGDQTALNSEATPATAPETDEIDSRLTSPSQNKGSLDLLNQNPSISSAPTQGYAFDGEKEQHTGIVLGIGLGSIRGRDQDGKVKDHFYLRPGDDVSVAFPNAGTPPRAIDQSFTIVDFYESKMSEYDATFAFVPIQALQKARGMIDPQTGIGAVTSIQIKLKPDVDLAMARDLLREEFPPESMVSVNSWKDTQGPLLAAVAMETTILNILLFMIIAVAGFGILATFFMIVVEKTRDIGVLKSLGAPGSGIAAIFLGYGVLLGSVGAGVGLAVGLVFVWKINEIARVVEFVTGREVFDPTVYYFDKIPTIVHPAMLVWVSIGSVLIAVLASVLPSIRAARMHPVEALRYE